jgi:hypothetical protein
MIKITALGIQFDEKALLIISAITLYNIPEGLSVDVSYASSAQEGWKFNRFCNWTAKRTRSPFIGDVVK